MRILIVSQFFKPEGTLKQYPIAKSLKDEGHEVQVLTGFPNYPYGKLYNGYKVKLFQREYLDGIEILRVPLYPSHDKSPFKRILNYMSYAISAAIIGPFVVNKTDVIYAYHPPATIAIPALIIKFLRRIPIIYDIQDLWPDTLRATGMIHNEYILRMVDWYCKLVYKFVDKFIVLSPGFKSKLIERNVPEENISVIYNWSSDIHTNGNQEIIAKKVIFGCEGFVFLYAGNMGKAQSLESIIEAARIVKKKNPGIYLCFMGEGTEKSMLINLKNKYQLSNVIIMNSVPVREVSRYLSAADVLIVHLKNDPLFSITIPSKTQAYLRTGKPILMGVNGDAADLLIKARAGIICKPTNPQDIADKILFMSNLPKEELETMGNNGRVFYDMHLSFKSGFQQFKDLANNLTT